MGLGSGMAAGVSGGTGAETGERAARVRWKGLRVSVRDTGDAEGVEVSAMKTRSGGD